MAKRGRPSKYSRKIADEICELLATGETLRSICRRNEKYPEHQTVRNWAQQDIDGFFSRYARARDCGIDAMVEETIDIADDGANDWMERQIGEDESIKVIDHEHVTRSRLRIDTRKWIAAKMAPKRYGESLTVEAKGIKSPLTSDMLDSFLADDESAEKA